MVPLHLSIQGLYSYQDRQEVDFSRLTEAGLFGIFGSVGSGKTTILEAMSLCIYGRTERFNQRGDDRYYNMLNLKEDEANVGFTFLAGGDSKKFRAEVKLRRNRRKFEDVGLIHHLFYQIQETGDPLPVSHETVLTAVGVSYENFKRTLVIPQGQFREFLELPPRERTEMMKELFGLQRFDRAARVSDLAVENRTRLTGIEGSLSQLTEATEEELKALELRSTELAREIGQWTLRHDEHRKALQELETLKSQSEALVVIRDQFNTLLQEGAGDASMLQRIARYEQHRDRYSVLLRDLDRLAASVREKEQAHDLLLTAREQRMTELVGAKAELEFATNGRQEAEALQTRADELEKMSDIHQLARDIDSLRERIRTEQARVGSGQSKIEEEHRSIAQLEAEVMGHQASILADDRCFSLRFFYKEQVRLQGVVAENEQLRMSRVQDLDGHRQQLLSLRDRLPIPLASRLPDALTEEAVEDASISAIAEVQGSKESIRGQLTRIAVQAGLRQYADGLVEGEPCILCGATHHPNPLQSAHPHDEERDLQNGLRDLDNAEHSLRNHADRIKGQLKAIAQAERGMTEADDALRASVQTLTAHRQGLNDTVFGPDDRQAFESADAASSLAKRHVGQAQESIGQHRKNIETWGRALEGLKKTVQDEQLKLAGLEGRYAMAVQSIRQLDLQTYLAMDVKDVQSERIEILTVIENALKRHESAVGLTGRLEREIGELGARIAQSSENLEGLRNEETNHRKELDTRLLADGLSDEEVREQLGWNPDIPGLRKAIDDRRQMTDTVRGRMQVLEQQVAGRNYDAVLHREAQEAFAESDGRVRSLTEARGAADEAIRVMSANIDTRRTLEEDHRLLTIRARDIATLQDMFRGNGFVQFVSQRYLENVVALANRRFRRMVRDKFSIELSEGGEFLVRDYLNGGRTRLLKSLSGGQTFQAALCLALALSENIQHTAGAEQHFFFMDEGFGSLDSENLETVFATLRSLQQERKAVGVISHVAELQQGMDIYLRIEQDPESGTRVSCSWDL